MGNISKSIRAIIKQNADRNNAMQAYFNPVTGEGSILDRVKVVISDFPIKEQYLPTNMMNVPLVKNLVKTGSVKRFLTEYLDIDYCEENAHSVVEQFVRIRYKFDFCFWAAVQVYIKQKSGGEDILFRLNRSQRRLITVFENKRLAGLPIRLILLKARQWGGSTATQMYFAWLQLIHKTGLNSLIVAHVKDTSTEILDMFDRMLKRYPVALLHKLSETYSEKEDKWCGVGNTGNIHRIPQRNSKIKIGTAEKPDSARGGDYNLVHCSEVALWKKTEGKTPEDIVRSACSGILMRPYTMIVYESTANGTGNFFHLEYIAAKKGLSQFISMFVAWFEIELYQQPFDSDKAKNDFASWLFKNKNNDFANSNREENGKYLWWLWEKGATLEGINWYIAERKKYTSHGDMASEYPSDDIEAFTFSGRMVFPREDIEQFRPYCKPPKWIGEIYGREETGEQALEDLRFKQEETGRLSMWADVEQDDEDEEVTDRYLVVVDVCKGRTKNADYSVILVLDRIYMIDGDKPAVIAQWYGHIDMDLLAWKATQIASYYNDALLVIESNTLETNNTKGEAEYILNIIKEVYPNLYARKQSAEDIEEGRPRKYGFHTNTLTKKVITHNLKTVLREHLYVERDEGCLDEYLTYIETDKGGYEAMSGHHDDKLMTRSIGLHVCFKEMDLPTIIKSSHVKVPQKRAISAATL